MIQRIKKYLKERSLEQFRVAARAIGALEEDIQKQSDEELEELSRKLRTKVQAGTPVEEVLTEAFALVREAARRTLHQRPYDVQLMGGLVLHRGAIAELSTGEGKTLAAVAPVYSNALNGAGVHVVTVNEYLARRDAVWMGKVYHFLGMTVACLVPNGAFMYDPTWHIPEDTQEMIDEERDATGSFRVQQEYLKPITRREAYLADITYGTNHEFGFDYLRDNLVYRLEDRVQRGHPFALIDEVDSILIDEARTPLIISAPDTESSELYRTFTRVVARLEKETDYVVDEKFKSVSITAEGINKVEAAAGVKNIYAAENVRMVRYMEECLRAKALFQRDKDYVIRNGEVIIVDEFTGRMLHGRRYTGGLHQAIEAKEGVTVQQESRTYAKISVQNYFRMYQKISGMTGTAQTSAEEFHKVYGLDVWSIPTHRPMIRKDQQDKIYKDYEAKIKAIVKDVGEKHKNGQPVLLGTTSIQKNEILSAALAAAGIPHEVLNAKNHEREGSIIAQAGRRGAVTVATNMAGRGVDVILGGNPPKPEDAVAVREAGGLHVIGTERHEARRIDNQLRGRAGRQGDPGESQFYLALDDDLLRIFGGDRIQGLLTRFNLPEDEPISMNFVSKTVAEAQAKVEGSNFDIRKHLLEYDDVLNKQRTAVYRKRSEILGAINFDMIAELIYSAANENLGVLLRENGVAVPGKELWEGDQIGEAYRMLLEAGAVPNGAAVTGETTVADARDLLRNRSKDAARDPETPARMLSILDNLWMNHLDDLESLSESVGLRAYGQRDPLVEYRRDANRAYRELWDNFNAWVFLNIFRMANPSVASEVRSEGAPVTLNILPANVRTNAPEQSGSMSTSGVIGDKVGRNDPCPCGSGKKYKKCHGK